MDYLKRDLPDLAAEIGRVAKANPAIGEALQDYIKVCKRLDDVGMSAAHRLQWNETHRELVAELRRVTLREVEGAAETGTFYD